MAEENGSESTESRRARTTRQRTSDFEIPASEEKASSLKDRKASTVRYLNGQSLLRPLDMPASVKRVAIICMVIALIIGGVFLSWYFDGVINEPKRQQAELEQLLASDVELDLPKLEELITMSDESISEYINEHYPSVFEKNPVGSEKPLNIIKLPSDVTAVDAAAMYLSGIDNLSALQLVSLMNGSWDLSVDRENGTSMVIHYADFSASSVNDALQKALVSQGFDQYPISDNGEDNSGNTYAAGNISTDDGDFSWRVSALPLDEIYSTRGLPENAVYVGIRMTS